MEYKETELDTKVKGLLPKIPDENDRAFILYQILLHNLTENPEFYDYINKWSPEAYNLLLEAKNESRAEKKMYAKSAAAQKRMDKEENERFREIKKFDDLARTQERPELESEEIRTRYSELEVKWSKRKEEFKEKMSKMGEVIRYLDLKKESSKMLLEDHVNSILEKAKEYSDRGDGEKAAAEIKKALSESIHFKIYGMTADIYRMLKNEDASGAMEEIEKLFNITDSPPSYP